MTWPQNVTRVDLRVEFIRGSGPGGQNRNKRDTACRITHLPTGLVGYAEDERAQGQNRRLAFSRLAAKLVPLMKLATKTGEAPARVVEEVRTYHAVDNRVTDHRLPERQWRFGDVLDGDALGEIVDELAKMARMVVEEEVVAGE